MIRLVSINGGSCRVVCRDDGTFVIERQIKDAMDSTAWVAIAHVPATGNAGVAIEAGVLRGLLVALWPPDKEKDKQK